MLTGVEYVERTVVCPAASCGRERKTRAAAGIRVSCPGCGGTYKVPPAPATTGTESPDVTGDGRPSPAPAVPLEREEAPDAPAGQTPASAGPALGPARVSIDVEEPTDADVAHGRKVMAALAAEPVRETPPTHPQTEVGKVHGSKGGRSRGTAATRYAERFRR